jgi:hypothetical protein
MDAAKDASLFPRLVRNGVGKRSISGAAIRISGVSSRQDGVPVVMVPGFGCGGVADAIGSLTRLRQRSRHRSAKTAPSDS